jgi:general secretion pathway protein K
VNNHSKQVGVALITALIFTALVTTFAVSIAVQQQIDIRRTGNILSSDRAYVLALGVEGWARDILKKDITAATGTLVDHLGEDWNVSLPAIQLEGATISGKITDLQGLINVNALVDANGAPVPTQVNRFKRLLELFGFNEDLSDALIDWIDPNTAETIPFGAEDSYYLSLEPSYRTANAPMVSISELRLVQGFDQETYETLLPFITALPILVLTTTPGGPPPTPPASINVNTAPLEVLQVLANTTLDLSDAESVRENGNNTDGFQTVAEFLADPIIASADIPVDFNGTVVSEYFLIEGDAVLADARTKLFSVVKRDSASSGNLTVLMRGQGSY